MSEMIRSIGWIRQVSARLGGACPPETQSSGQNREAAVAYGANTHGTVAEGEAVVSVIVNRVKSGLAQFGCKKSCTVGDVLSHKPGFAEVGNPQYKHYLAGKANNKGAQNAAKAAKYVGKNGPTTNAMFYIENPGGGAPKPGEVKALGKVGPAKPSRVGGVYLYKVAPPSLPNQIGR